MSGDTPTEDNQTLSEKHTSEKHTSEKHTSEKHTSEKHTSEKHTSIQTYLCQSKCCKIYVKAYSPDGITHFHSNCRKAGVVIYDPKEDRVLLVQSRGHLWGNPKGAIKEGEHEKHCAIREVKEETGLTVKPHRFMKTVRILDRAIYFYTEIDTCDVSIQTNENLIDNDANGITWIKMSCLENEIVNGSIVLNHHARIVFEKIFKKTFPKCEWITVKRKR
jgi:ADP-ribose pyrophosphatase YjhB (NUDIX family)